ncbi:Solute carrier family 15 member 2 [Lamellibrachia satsuma]|nr:Solute carrier family 15 member 2 [Lamellibrachia satsuma]
MDPLLRIEIHTYTTKVKSVTLPSSGQWLRHVTDFVRYIRLLVAFRALEYDDNSATAIYHVFNFVCYFLPLFGALLSDGWIGKYKWTPLLSLMVTAIGTGGIKACVSAFGGDQFEEHQVRQKEAFFSIFYMSINIGSLLSIIITPILKSEVFCFGDNCYTLAFGIPAGLMVIALISFIAGTRWYKRVETKENVIGMMFGCIWTALRGKCSCRKNVDEGPKEHWLDHAEGRYTKTFVSDVKCVLQVMYLFLPFPIFWALFDQQGSRWTLQSAQMNGDFGSFVIQPDLIQKLHIPNSPLQRLGVGMFLAGTAFVVTVGIQVMVDKNLPTELGDGLSRIRFINAAPYDLNLKFQGNEFSVHQKQMSSFTDVKFGSYNVTVQYNNTKSKTFPISFNNSVGYHFVFAEPDSNDLQLKAFQQEQIKRTEKGKSTAWVINTLNQEIDVDLKNPRIQLSVILNGISPMGNSSNKHLAHADYQIHVNSTDGTTFDSSVISKNGAVNTIVVQYDGAKIIAVKHEDVEPNNVNIFWQVPQYIVMTIGECFFSVTGLSFAYSQAPASMKSVLQAAFLLTIAFGNLIVVIVSKARRLPNQTAEFLLFAGLMYVTLFIYVLMSLSYKYKDEGEMVVDDDDVKPGKENDIKVIKTPEADHKSAMNGTDGDGTDENVELEAPKSDKAPNGGTANAAFDAGDESTKL